MDTPSNTERGGAREENFSWKKRIILWALILGPFLVVCWALTIYDAIVVDRGHPWEALYFHGIRPRTSKGILGILAAPFLHAGFHHVEVDTLGVLILGSLLMLSSFKTFFGVTLFVWLVGGLATWCVGSANSSIIGCGLLCFGWFGYMVVTPFFERPISIKAIAIAAVAGLLYGGLIFGLFSTNPMVAWAANVCSLLSGVICSVGYWYFYRKYLAKHVEKCAPALSAKLPTSPHIPSFKREQSSSRAFPNAIGDRDTAIVPQSLHPMSSSQPQTNRLLLDDSSSPFGHQDIFQEAPVRNSSEPEWLFGPKGNPPPPTTSSYPSSSNPSWLVDSSTKEMTSFPPPPAHSQSFNPFG